LGRIPGRELTKIIEPTKKSLETLWGGPLGEHQKNTKNKQSKTKKTKKPNPLEIL